MTTSPSTDHADAAETVANPESTVSSAKYTVAIVGRPNVGKSTLINRIIGSRTSIVDDMPGVTRDRSYHIVEWQTKRFTLIDTGGLIPNPTEADTFADLVNVQVDIAIEEADMIMVVVDGLEGVHPLDEEITRHIRKRLNKRDIPIYIIVNKMDRADQIPMASEFYQLGFDNLYTLSALHGSVGVGDMLDDVIAQIPEEMEPEDTDIIKLCILGRPNVGKSSLLNTFVGQNRTIVSDIPGTTRDAINVSFEHVKDDGETQSFEVVDTAGIRRKTKVGYGVEMFSVDRSLRALRECDVAIIVVDASENATSLDKPFVTDQDKRLIQQTIEDGRAIVLVVNKWDLIENKTTQTIEEYKNSIFLEVPHARFAEIIFTSAMTGKRVKEILKRAMTAHQNWKRRIKTSILNQVINEAVALHDPPRVKNKLLKIYYGTQPSSAPPTFILFVNDAKLLTDNYRRYLEKKLRENFMLEGTPIHVVARSRGE